MDFKEQLISYSEGIDEYPEARFKKFRQTYLKIDKYNKADVQNASDAALALYTWATAIDKFQTVKKNGEFFVYY